MELTNYYILNNSKAGADSSEI